MPGATAGYGIKWSPQHTVSQRLEGDGPETSNRAELRAAIAALTLREWDGEGFDTVVLACDSEYVVLGLSERIQKWIERGWRTASGSPVMNRDLWEMLLAELERKNMAGIMVKFWWIPRGSNEEADRLAKAGALKGRDSSMDDICFIEGI